MTLLEKRRNLHRKELRSGDYLVVMLTMMLVIFGVVMVFSASYYTALKDYGDPYYFFKKEIMFVLVGTVLMLFVAIVDYHVYRKFSYIIIAASFILLFLVFTPLGVTRNYATRWIGIGPVTLMPGEVAKLGIILFIAWYLSENPERIRSFKYGILPMMALAGGVFGLIYLQPNLSTAITIFIIAIGMMFVAGAKISHLFVIGFAGIVAGVFAIFVDPDGGYRLARMTHFTDPFQDHLASGYQVVQSLYALGSGGFRGVGFGRSIQKNLYLPDAHNDFILSIIGEELGFLGILLLLTAYMLLIWRGINVSINAKDMYGSLLASGVTIMMGVQLILHVATVTSSMPPTGITLPFVSYGGNAIWMFMIAMGLLINISRYKP